MDTATQLIIEAHAKTISLTLRKPMALADIYACLVKCNRRPILLTLANGIARATY